MTHCYHIERIQLGSGFVVEFEYACTVDHANKDFPVTARMTSGTVYHYGKRAGTWEEHPRFWGTTVGHDWTGFESRVIETANAQLKQAA